MPSSIILEHFRYPKDAEVLLNNIKNTYVYMFTHVCTCIHEKRKLLFCLLTVREGIHILRKKSRTKQQQRITKDPILQLQCGQRSQSYYREQHVVYMRSLDFRNFGSPLQFRVLLFMLKIAHWHLQLSSTSSCQHHNHLTTVLKFLCFRQIKRDDNPMFKYLHL